MSQQINLYNPAFIPKRQLLTANNLALASAVLYLSLAAVGTWASMQAKQKQAAAAEAQAQQKKMQEAFEVVKRAAEARKPNPALQAEITRLEAMMSMQGEVLAELDKGLPAEGGKGGRASFADYLRGLARQSREGLWLTGFAVNAQGEGMQLRGRTVDNALLPDYIKRLNAEPAFAGKSFASLHMGRAGAIEGDAARSGGEVKSTAAPTVSTTEAKAAPGLPPRFVEFQLQAEKIAPAEGAKPAGGGFAMATGSGNPLLDTVVNSPLNPALRGAH